MQFTLRFSVLLVGEQNAFEMSNGVLIDRKQIQMVMDDLVEVLSQPGISVEGAFDPSVSQVWRVRRALYAWGLPMLELSLQGSPVLWNNTLSSMDDLVGEVNGAQPGIYLLRALPEHLNSASLPPTVLPRPFVDR